MKVLIACGVLLGIFAYKSSGQGEDLRATGELRRACSKRGAVKQPPNRVNTTARLIALRNVMRDEIAIKERPIDAYLITSGDEHQSEYVAPYDQRRQYISGFSGSYGDAVVTLKKSALWTDGRYHIQADDQINCDWLLMREGQSKVPSISEWLSKELKPNSRIGADPKLVPASTWNNLRHDLESTSIKLVEINVNLIDLIWKDHEEEYLDKAAFVWDIKYAGKNWTTKIAETRLTIKEAGADAMVVTSLDEIAWLLNIRGRDIPYNPFVRSYVVLSHDTVSLYVNRTKLVKNNVTKHLRTDFGITLYSVKVLDYEKIWIDLPTMAQAWKKILLPSQCVYSLGASHKIYSLIPKHKRLPRPSPIIFLKAVKNPIEIEGMKRAHIRDAAAMCMFFSYLESRVDEGDVWTEMEVVRVIDEFRFEQKYSLGNSFTTVVGFGSNGAQPHYEPSQSTDSTIFHNSTLVIDSGGQYFDGTTDVTRTIHLGVPTDQQINAYTRVLMGSIQLSTLTFPSNMKSAVADVMARAPLWESGLDYMHGTGHGVGSFLGVHESPINVHYESEYEFQQFTPGYFFSNEPGFYNEGDFGVRLENVLEVVNKPWLKHMSGQSFLGFKDVTLVPYEPKLINTSLLTIYHIRWLNDYNSRIREFVGHELKEQNRMDAFYWMMEKTKYIPGSSNTVSSKPVWFLLTNAALMYIVVNNIY